MNIEELRDYCLGLPGVTEKMPWVGKRTFAGGLCFYVGGKWFCLTNVDHFQFINIKLPPAINEELRARYEAVRPGWHMNKRYWSSVYIDGDLSADEIKELIRMSYRTVAASLPATNPFHISKTSSNTD